MPRLLDLFCGAGGASVGYARAGFEVVGVDIVDQPRYPFEFHQADAMTFPLDGFDAVHASPPCQAYSVSTAGFRHGGKSYPDLVAPTRARLRTGGVPWVIENVPGAPIRPDYRLCGCLFDLGIKRERWFETSWHGFELRSPCHHAEPLMNTLRKSHGPWYRIHRRTPTRGEIAHAMGVEWMRGEEFSQAIPPAYTLHIGSMLMEYLDRESVRGGRL